MNVLFRADASVAIGTGHVMRCVTLAQHLTAEGAQVTFACRRLEGNMNAWLRAQGFWVIDWEDANPASVPKALEAYLTEVCPQWLVVDHYQLDAQWEQNLRSRVQRILVIDDLANRPHDCDLLLDQNYFAQPQARYLGRILGPAQCLLGPRYALLRSEFVQAREGLLQRGGRDFTALRRIQVCFGGSDPTGETQRALEALAQVDLPQSVVDVIVGASNPNKDQLQARCAQHPNWRFHCQTSDMAQLMAEADLAIGAGGTTTWERLCVGLPALVIAVAENQRPISEAVAEAGAHLYLGTSGSVNTAHLVEAISHLSREPALLARFSERALALVDGQGASRVAAFMHKERF